MWQDNRTGEGGSSHNSPAGVTRQSSCGNSAPLQVVVESWRIHSPCHVLCVRGGIVGGGGVVEIGRGRCLGPTLLPAF